MPRAPQTYYLAPTSRVPNSPQPLLYYPSFFASDATTTPTTSSTTEEPSLPDRSLLPLPPSTVAAIHERFTKHAWTPQWIFRYGPTQPAHYHSRTHECMVVLSGRARIRFGVADPVIPTTLETAGDEHGAGEGQDGDGRTTVGASVAEEDDGDDGGVEIDASVGDVFVLPAGTMHKTFATRPEEEFALLTPGEGKGVSREGVEGAMLKGFTMMGAYPRGSAEWDFRVGGEDVGEYEEVWRVPRPEYDPVLGMAPEGMLQLWRE